MPLTNPGVFNIAKGIWRYYCTLPGTDDAIIWVILKAPTQSDDVMNNYDNLGSLIAQNPECDRANYARKVTTSMTPTQNNTANTADVDTADQTWSALVTGDSLGGLVLAYRPASNSNDGACIPLFYYPFVGPTNGSDVVAAVHAAGLAGAV